MEINQTSQNLSFNKQKSLQKLGKKIKDLEYQKKQIEQESAERKIAEDKIETKANELQKIIQSLEKKKNGGFKA